MGRPETPTPSSGNRPRNADAPGKRPHGSNGQGANSALAEMLRRQAQNPRPGGSQQQQGAGMHDLRERPPEPARNPRG